MALTLVVEKLGGKIYIRCDATEVAVHGGEWLELRTALLCLEDYVAEASRCHVGSPDTRAADSFWIGTDTQIAKAKLQERRNKIAALLEQTYPWRVRRRDIK
jgi:hypothetical protein